jgi:hypothetical protein
VTAELEVMLPAALLGIYKCGDLPTTYAHMCPLKSRNKADNWEYDSKIATLQAFFERHDDPTPLTYLNLPEGKRDGLASLRLSCINALGVLAEVWQAQPPLSNLDHNPDVVR